MVIRGFLLSISLFVLLSASPQFASANDKDFIVFDVRKTLPLNDADPVYKDFYVNIGSEAGVKPGQILAVYRRIPVVDFYRNKAQGDLVVPVGHLRVIHSQKTMSVCRIASIASEKQIPVVQYETIMMGDRVEIAGGGEALDVDKNLSHSNNSSDAAMNDPSTVTGEAERQPAATAAANADPQTQTQAPAKTLPAKKMNPKQAKPSVTAVPLPAQASFDAQDDSI